MLSIIYRSTLLLFFVVSLSCISTITAQEKKGDKLAEKHLYKDAIRAYEKSSKKADSELFYKLAKLYTKTKQYHKAVDTYEKATDFDNIQNKIYMDYGLALISINKPQQAKVNFKIYADLMEGDPRAEIYMLSCDEIIEMNKQPAAWEINSLSGINTPKSEICPHPYLNGLIYTTNGSRDWVNYEEYEALHNNFYEVEYAKSRSNNFTFEKGNLLSPKILGDYHVGPVALTPDSSAIYYCKVVRTGKAEKMHLFYAEIKDGKIGPSEEFNYNNNEYSFMHPCFSDNGKFMYLASDKPGGDGGFDIFFCKKSRRYGWSAPRPVPGLINTSKDELFPHYQDGKLFFASDGHFGLGGLDIFVAIQKEQFKVITNLKAPLNSSYDDFAYFAVNEKNGYFCSNREGGKGDDDIYGFHHLEEIKEDENPTMTGVFEYKKLRQGNVELVLYDEEGNEIARTTTDANGNFEFRNLRTDQNYSILPVGEFEDTDIFITNANGEKIVLMSSLKNGQFQFRPLKYDDSADMIPVEEEYPTFLTIRMGGFVYRKLKGDLNGRFEVQVYDEYGKLIARGYTNQDGSFDFRHLIPKGEYTIKVLTEEEVYISLNGLEDEGEQPEKIGNAEFQYRRLKDGDRTFKIINEENVLLELRNKESFTLPSIYYETNSYKINAASAEQLDLLYILLKKNSNIIVNFESYTDSRGKDSYNMKLSENRSEAAVKYLIKKGIPKEKLVAKGYGETKLLNHCKNGVNCSQEEHSINRRTEISIIGKQLKF